MAGFLDSLLPLAKQASARTGIDPRIIAAQAVLETGWGKHAPGGNYFGIKSHGKPGGQRLKTNEVINGRNVSVNDSFRKYGSMGDSVSGYADFMLNNPRYKPLREAEGLDNQINALQASGYATDPNYGAKIRSIIGRIDSGDLPKAAGQSITLPPFQKDQLGPDGSVQTQGSAMNPNIDWNFIQQVVAQMAQQNPNAPSTPGQRMMIDGKTPILGTEQEHADPTAALLAAGGGNVTEGPMAPPQDVQAPPGGPTTMTALQGQAPLNMAQAQPRLYEGPQSGTAQAVQRQNEYMALKGQPPMQQPQGGAMAPQGAPGAPTNGARPPGRFRNFLGNNSGLLTSLGAALLAHGMDTRRGINPGAIVAGAGMDQRRRALSDKEAREQQQNIATADIVEGMGNPDMAALIRSGNGAAEAAAIMKAIGGKGGDAGVFGTPIYTKDEKGNLGVGVIGKDGSFKQLDVGGAKITQPTTKLDLGTTQAIVGSRTGETIRTDKVDVSGKAREGVLGKAEGERIVEAPTAIAKADRTIAQIDEILNDPLLDSATGMGGMLRGAVWGSPEYGFARKVDQLAGGAFLEAYQELKGGGQITEIEGKKAEAAMGRLDRAQSADDFRKALKDFRDVIETAKKRQPRVSGATPPNGDPADPLGIR